MAVPTFTLTGTLVDISNRPMSGIRVMVFTRPSMQFVTDGDDHVVIRSAATATDKDGKFSFTLVTKADLHYRVAPEHSAAFDPITFLAPSPGTTINIASVVPSLPPAGGVGGGGASPTLSNVPAGSTITVYRGDDGWPARPVSRTDITVQWIGGTVDDPPTERVVGVDLWGRPGA